MGDWVFEERFAGVLAYLIPTVYKSVWVPDLNEVKSITLSPLAELYTLFEYKLLLKSSTLFVPSILTKETIPLFCWFLSISVRIR